MKAIILAGGLGTRLSEETIKKPKPMVEIGKRPIIWHIMMLYSHHGIKNFIICCGYKSHIIEEFFNNFNKYFPGSNVVIDGDKVKINNKDNVDWEVRLVDTGLETMTGGRLKRVEKYLTNEENFCFTYGDGLSDINIRETIDFHKSHNKMATITAVHPPGRFGALEIKDKNMVKSFKEKPEGDDSWINGGFFVLSKSIFKLIKDDKTFWEKEPLEKLASDGELVAYKHHGFWQPMDTLREKNLLEDLWKNNPPWKKWK